MNKKKLFNALIVCLLVYVNLTTLEWVVHKYVMHGYDRPNMPILGALIENESALHWAHHREVLSDMTLDLRTNEVTHRGLFFRYQATVTFTVFIFALLTLQFRLFKMRVSPKTTALITLASTLGYSFMWNNFHASLHGEHNLILPVSSGVTNRYQKHILNCIPAYWFKWMMYNHAHHHSVKGVSKGNYNIILPGFDYIMGTYNKPPCFENTEFCEGEDLKACDKPKGCFKLEGKALRLL